MTTIHKPNLTQQGRILKILQEVKDRTHQIPIDYILEREDGDGISGRYFQQVMLISQTNARICELRRQGFPIKSSEKHKDRYGFVYYRLQDDRKENSLFEEPL